MSLNQRESEGSGDIFFDAVTKLQGDAEPFTDPNEDDLLIKYFPEGETIRENYGFAFSPEHLGEIIVNPYTGLLVGLIKLSNGKSKWVPIMGSSESISFAEPVSHKICKQ